jgi:pyridoxine 5-phosphate synthase
MVRLSVNVNKVATLRNARGGREPRVLDAVAVCLKAGAEGITVHPRADERHITKADVRDIAQALRAVRPGVEYNIEGDPRPDLIELVREVRPEQCTLVPVQPGEITSQAGWRPESAGALADVIRDFKARGVRVSVFVDADPEPVRWAASVGADRIELYTEPFARAFERGGAGGDAAARSFARYAAAAELAHSLGLGINAGHDLDLDNLTIFRELPHLDEVSIGHAIVSRALFVGLETVVGEYRRVLAGARAASA